MDDNVADLKKLSRIRLNDHAERLTSLEGTRNQARGFARLGAVLVATLGSVAAYFKWS